MPWDYRKLLCGLQDYSFESFRKLSCQRLAQLSSEVDDNQLFESLDRGKSILETEAQADKYMQAFGKKHFVKFKTLFATIPPQVFDEYFDVVDWGCGPGLGIIALNDFCRQTLKREIESKVRNIILIEPSAVALYRAETHARLLFGESHILGINKKFQDLTKDDFFCEGGVPIPRLHVFSNVLDLPLFRNAKYWGEFISLLNHSFCRNEIFLCLSPSYGDVKQTIARFKAAWMEKEEFKASELLGLTNKVFTKEKDGSDVTMTASALKLINIESCEKLKKIVNKPLINKLIQNRDSSPAQQKLVSYVSKQCSDKDYDILYQPNFMGDCPDLLILRAGYHPQLVYCCDIRDESPASLDKLIDLVTVMDSCKKNLYNLLSRNLRDSNFGLIRCVVYLPNMPESFSSDRLRRLLSDHQKNKNCENLKKTINYTCFHVRKFIVSNSKCKHMTDAIYGDLKNIITPNVISLPKRIDFEDGSKHAMLALSRADVRQKISGVYGSGKTTLMAVRAVNAYKRTHRPVLILTYNIALRNYIEAILFQQFGEFNRNQFYVVNYHQFLRGECNLAKIMKTTCDCETKSCEKWKECRERGGSRKICFDDYEFFMGNKKAFSRKYSSVFIDEAQDFKYDWFKIISDVFVADLGEYVIFGDVKQNVYGRPLEENKIKTNIPGNWNVLKQCYRSNPVVLERVREFQHKMREINGADVDEFETSTSKSLPGLWGHTGVYDFERHDVDGLVNQIRVVSEKHHIAYKDIVVVGEKTELLRNIDAKYRALTGHLSECAFAPLEHESVNATGKDMVANTETLIDKTSDRGYKLHFNVYKDCIKFSTIHSFKGFEADTVICIISGTKEDSEVEVIYTGLTRARCNLFVFNHGNTRYAKQLRSIFI